MIIIFINIPSRFIYNNTLSVNKSRKKLHRVTFITCHTFPKVSFFTPCKLHRLQFCLSFFALVSLLSKSRFWWVFLFAFFIFLR